MIFSKSLQLILCAVPAVVTDSGILKDYNGTGCKVTVVNEDGDEEERSCTMFENEEFLKNARAMGRILTSSGHELRQYPELTKWLVNEEYEKFHGLDLEVTYGQEPILQILDPKTKKVKDTIELKKHSSRSELESLLTSLDFEQKASARSDEL